MRIFRFSAGGFAATLALAEIGDADGGVCMALRGTSLALVGS